MADKKLVERTVAAIKENADGRAVVMYGRNLDIQGALENEGIRIEAVFTGNKELLADETLHCTDYKDMNGKADAFYIIIPFFLPDGGKHQRQILEAYGYKENFDYFFFQEEQAESVIVNEVGSYSDRYGNIIECEHTNTVIKILNGRNNHITVRAGVKSTGHLYITAKGNNNIICINPDCIFNGNNYILSLSNLNIFIGNGCKFTDMNIACFNNSSMQIQERCTFSKNMNFYVHAYSNIVIERDAMFSSDIFMQSGDGHSIFDVNTKENINSNPNLKNEDGFLSEIHIGPHVWVGREAAILSGLGKTEIGSGSIIGARALVKGKFRNNCVVAGIPAKEIKKDVAWSRRNMAENIESCGEYANFTGSYVPEHRKDNQMNDTIETRNKKYNILLTPSSAHFPYAMVAMISAIQNCSKSINFFIMQNDWTDEQKRVCSEFIEKHNLCTVTVIDVRDEDFKCFGSWRGRYETSYKLLAHQYIPQELNGEYIDRVMYIDTDIYFAKDIGDMYFENFNGAVAAIAVHPTLTFKTLEQYKQTRKNGEWPNYFVGGTVLWNLQALRDEKVDEEYYKTNVNNLGYEPLFADEGIYNELFRDRIRPEAYYKFNYMLGYHEKYKDAYRLTEQERIDKCNGVYYEEFDSRNMASIVHFAGGPDIIPKPWSTVVDESGRVIGVFNRPGDISELGKYYRQWWSYAALLPKEIYSELKVTAFDNVMVSIKRIENDLFFSKNAGTFYNALSENLLTTHSFEDYLKSLTTKKVSILSKDISTGRFMTKMLDAYNVNVVFKTNKSNLKHLTNGEWNMCRKADVIIACCIHGTLPLERDGIKPIMINDILKLDTNALSSCAFVSERIFHEKLDDFKNNIYDRLADVTEAILKYQKTSDEFNSIKAENLSLNDSLNKLKLEYDQLNRKYMDLQTESEVKIRRGADELNSAKSQIQKMASVERKNDDLQQQLTNYEQSRSWKITKPLRSIAWFFRRLFGKSKQ